MLVFRVIEGLPYIQITDQALVILQNVIGIAGSLSVFDQRVAIQSPHVYKTANQVSRFSKIPVEFISPDGDFFVEQRIQVFRAQTPEIHKLRNVRSGGGFE